MKRMRAWRPRSDGRHEGGSRRESCADLHVGVALRRARHYGAGVFGVSTRGQHAVPHTRSELS
jgi:hypothetical protein